MIRNSRRLIAPALGVLMALIVSLAWSGDTDRASEEPKARPVTEGKEDHATITLRGFQTELTRDGLPMQRVYAEWGRYDQVAEILDLREVKATFFSKGTKIGEAHCGRGQIWLSDQHLEETGYGRQDVLLTDDVNYRTMTGIVIQSPRMVYTSSDATIRSKDPYIKQIKIDNDGYWIGRGDGFEIKISIEESTFDTWYEYGNPAVMKKMETPELTP